MVPLASSNTCNGIALLDLAMKYVEFWSTIRCFPLRDKQVSSSRGSVDYNGGGIAQLNLVHVAVDLGPLSVLIRGYFPLK